MTSEYQDSRWSGVNMQLCEEIWHYAASTKRGAAVESLSVTILSRPPHSLDWVFHDHRPFAFRTQPTPQCAARLPRRNARRLYTGLRIARQNLLRLRTLPHSKLYFSILSACTDVQQHPRIRHRLHNRVILHKMLFAVLAKLSRDQEIPRSIGGSQRRY